MEKKRLTLNTQMTTINTGDLRIKRGNLSRRFPIPPPPIYCLPPIPISKLLNEINGGYKVCMEKR